MIEAEVKDGTKPVKPRAAARRRQIVDAAAKCFRRHGFHAASMAQVAATAGMSVGHIYRYFPSKEAIIAAIVEEQLDVALLSFPHNSGPVNDVPAHLRKAARRAARRGFHRQRSVLMLEIRAEATRNDAIAEIVGAADREIAARASQMIVTGFAPDAVPADIEQRIAMLGLVIDGVTTRAVAEPSLDVRVIDALLDLVIDNIFSANTRL